MEGNRTEMTEKLRQGLEALREILRLMSINAEVEGAIEEDIVSLHVKGPDAANLIGPEGFTIDAIQFIVNKMVNRFPEDRRRVEVDIDGFMVRRKQDLEAMARDLAQKAKKTGRRMVISSMNARDRRIVHLALENMGDVATRSEGEGPFRRLIIEIVESRR